MKKRTKIKNYLKLGVFFLGTSLFLWNCQQEDIPLEVQQEKAEIEYNTVSKSTAQRIFQNRQKTIASSTDLSARSTGTRFYERIIF